jgi:hypothetical protein
LTEGNLGQSVAESGILFVSTRKCCWLGVLGFAHMSIFGDVLGYSCRPTKWREARTSESSVKCGEVFAGTL